MPVVFVWAGASGVQIGTQGPPRGVFGVSFFAICRNRLGGGGRGGCSHSGFWQVFLLIVEMGWEVMAAAVAHVCGEGCLLIRNRDRDCNKCPPAGPDNGKGSAKHCFISMASPILTQSCKFSEEILGVEARGGLELDFWGEGCL